MNESNQNLKRELMELIDSLPPHEGKTFEEALADHLLANGWTKPVPCGKCQHYDKNPHGCLCEFHDTQMLPCDYCSYGTRKEQSI